MERRDYLLKPFEQEKEYMERRVAEGIEARKADARLKILHRDGTPVFGAHIRAKQMKQSLRISEDRDICFHYVQNLMEFLKETDIQRQQ